MTTPTTQETPPGQETPPEDQGVTPVPADPAEPTEEQPEPVTDDQEQETDDQESDPLRVARGEAARHRREKQEALAALSTAQEALQASRRAHAESLLPEGALSQRGDLWFNGATVDQVLDESGNVSRELVLSLADNQVAQRPGLGRGTRPSHGAGGRGNPSRGSVGYIPELHDPEDVQRSITSLYDAAQATRVGALKDPELIRRVTGQR